MIRTNPWDWDLPTFLWVGWMIQFFVYEWIGSRYGNEMFTHHVWWVRNWAWKEGATIVIFLLYAILAWLVFHFVREGWRFFGS